jgi:hypothetical protein
MQKKFPYSVLKWTLLLGVASSLATACVVTSGDGTNISLGGEGNNTTDGGEPSSGGSTSTAGKGGSGGSTSTAGKGGTSSAGTTSMGGEGGTSAAYVPGKCQVDAVTPASEPSCDDAKPMEDPCRVCLRTKACSQWQACYAENPTTACGFGPKEDDGGQFGCILTCFFDNKAGETDPDKLFADCSAGCALQCDGADKDQGLIMDSTNDLAGEAYSKCNAECFPFQ